MESAFSCFFIIIREVDLENVSPLVLGEISGVFVNTLTSDANYSVQGYENLQLPIQMQLSERQKTFPQFFV